MWWILPSVAALTAVLAAIAAAARVKREVEPTRDTIDGFGRRLRPAVVELRAQTARARARSTRGS